MQKRCNLLTLLCVIYQPHKENAVYSELISKLFSLRVSEQEGSCPELQSHLQRPVLAAGPAPRGTAPAASLQGSVVHRGCPPHRGVGVKKVGGREGVSFLTPSLLVCPKFLSGGCSLSQGFLILTSRLQIQKRVRWPEFEA